MPQNSDEASDEVSDEFKNGSYDGIVIFFGVHGDSNWLFASDRKAS